MTVGELSRVLDLKTISVASHRRGRGGDRREMICFLSNRATGKSGYRFLNTFDSRNGYPRYLTANFLSRIS